MKNAITQAVILMAGSGSRLWIDGRKSLKPMIPVLGRPLISYTLEALTKAGIKTAYVIIGFEAESLKAQIGTLIPPELRIRFIENPEWRKQNGISVLAAAEEVSGPFLLTMSDHLFDQSIVDDLLRDSVIDQLNLAVDRKLETIFDINDAMKVETRDDHLAAIGKDLDYYDAIDTGLFVCPTTIFDYLEQEKRNGDCSLADGVRAMARAGQARIVDVGPAWWQDVDTPEMLAFAEDKLRSRNRDSIPASPHPA